MTPCGREFVRFSPAHTMYANVEIRIEFIGRPLDSVRIFCSYERFKIVWVSIWQNIIIFYLPFRFVCSSQVSCLDGREKNNNRMPFR